jgi:hypothetical protein
MRPWTKPAEEWTDDIEVLSEADRKAIEQEIADLDAFAQLATSIDHDVVVVNFLNRKNAADQRVFELLSEKFHLFEGVFGASDEVLGAIESGVDFERRIAAIYQRCRKPNEIQGAFDQLQLELSLEINESMTRIRQKLLEHFDDEVREKLKMRDEASKTYLNRYERLLMQLTRHELCAHAEFLGDATFRLKRQPFPDRADAIPLGQYELPRRTGEAHLYRLNHPLAEALVARAKGRDLPTAEMHFDYGQHDGKVTLLEPFIGKAGWLALSLISVESLDQAEDHLIIAAATNDGAVLHEEVAARLLTLPGTSSRFGQGGGRDAGGVLHQIQSLTEQRQAAIQRGISERNARFFEAEADKLDGWAGPEGGPGTRDQGTRPPDKRGSARRDARVDPGREAYRAEAGQGPRSAA